MPYQDDGPTDKLHIYPGARRARRRIQALKQLSPMPALEELAHLQVTGDELANLPTEPLILPEAQARAKLSRYPTVPLVRIAGGDEGKQGKRGAGKRRARKDPPVGPRHLPRRRRRRRSRRALCLLTALLILFVLGGIALSGLYALETTVLAPLAQFFHPIKGDNAGTINGRAWNLLLLGSDNDNKFTFPAILTQVMMVVHVDPSKNSVFMLSIPRDSWVAVPGQSGMYKIDQAFYLGASQRQNFDDGVRLARATIEQDYGISIDRYAWVGLDGFASVIDTLGGVDIDVAHPLLDDNYPDDTGSGTHANNPYAIKRLYLPPGPQHLNGEQALEYVRSRHADLVGDIGRTQRQQAVLEALKKKLNISTVFDHLSGLFHDLTGKVYTDLSEQELLSVANFARGLPASAIQRLTLGPGSGNQNYGTMTTVTDPGLDDSQDIIQPDCANIQPVVNRAFDLGNAQSCQVNGPGS